MNQSDRKSVLINILYWLFPPAQLLRIWRRGGTVFQKIFLSIVVVIQTVLMAAIIIAFLIFFTGLQVEWRGSSIPTLTYHKTKPDYEALERSRQMNIQGQPLKQVKIIGSTYWTGFRGPNRDGVYAEMPILTNWGVSGPPLVWKQPCGGGHSSFAIAQGRAFTIEQRRDNEAVVAYDLGSGRELWIYSYKARFDNIMGGEGPRATPTWYNGRVYSLGALGDLVCLDAIDGKLNWSHNILSENNATNLPHGMAASPLVVKDKVIVLPGGTNGASVVAYHWRTGDVLWKSLSEKQAYSSAMYVTLCNEPQLLIFAGKKLIGMDIESGKLLWEYPWVSEYDNNIAQPVIIGTNRVFISSSYGAGCAALELKKNGSSYRVELLWKNKNLKNRFSSSVYLNGFIYGLDEENLVCIDAIDGSVRWRGNRYGYGQLMAASNHLIILCGNGDLALVKAVPEKFTELYRVNAIKGKTWNHPAIGEAKLLIRNSTEMACYDLGIY